MSSLLSISVYFLTVYVMVNTVNCQIPDDWVEKISPPYYLLSLKADIYIIPMLTWGEDQLEPHLDVATFKAHYWGHHFAYRKKMNNALNLWREEEPDNQFAHESILEIIRNLDKIPEKYRTNLKNNGGGFVNHCFYWACMAPVANHTQDGPTGSLKADIESTFGSVEEFKEKFTDAAITLFGSGYVWLSRMPASQGSKLVLHTTRDQDCPLSDNLFPILVIDVWEHAYYLKHQHRRSDYLPNWWSVVNWAAIEALDNWWVEIYPNEMTRKDEL